MLSLLLAQVALILLLARGLGRVARLLHQPQVVGEMVAGVELGPSVLGYLFPELLQRPFPLGAAPRCTASARSGC